MIWEIALKNKDKNLANQLVQQLSNIRKHYNEDFNKFAEEIQYPLTNVWINGELNPHFRRILVELKILSITGKTTFKI